MSEETPRVLLVDDERFARQLYSDYLAAAGCDVVVAESAQLARALFAPGRFHVVVTDLLLPDSDGLEVLAEVKRADPDVDVIVITGFERVEPAVRALRGGASDYLVKPVTPDTLQLSVQRCLSLRRVLRENAALKASLALLEASQRIALAPDRARLAEGILPALATALDARSGLVIAGRGGAYELVRSQGLSPADAEQAAALVAPTALLGPDVTSPSVGEAPGQVAALAGLRATVVPLRADGLTHGAAVLFSERMPAPEALAGVSFLAGTAAVSLSNLHRLSQVERLAFVDDLTHVFNARYLRHVLDRETAAGARPFALLFVDLDHFKLVNDTHGHQVGSQLLVEVARILRGCVREKDVCTRYGGDEFCLVLAGSDEPNALRVAERIRGAIEAHAFLAREGLSLRVTASIGVACWPDQAKTKHELVDLADQAMYRSKRAGRNAVYLAKAREASSDQYSPTIAMSK